jgi:catechol 2,3-dioxygenase-like lactoylglutathione lyase family enzyme
VVDALHHVNIVTAKLDAMIRFYVTVVGLEQGMRPGFESTGAWLYAGTQPVVHLVQGTPDPRRPLPQLEHFAFRAHGLPAFLARLGENGIPCRTTIVPDLGWPVVNFADPDGNRVEIVFPGDELPAPAM